MDPKTAFDQRDDIRFIDVREPFEWDAGHIENAIHVPIQRLREQLDGLDSEVPVVTVCTVGMRAAYAAEVLASAGFRAESLEGGLVGWEEAGLPVVRDDGASGEVWRS